MQWQWIRIPCWCSVVFSSQRHEHEASLWSLSLCRTHTARLGLFKRTTVCSSLQALWGFGSVLLVHTDVRPVLIQNCLCLCVLAVVTMGIPWQLWRRVSQVELFWRCVSVVVISDLQLCPDSASAHNSAFCPLVFYGCASSDITNYTGSVVR